MAQQAGLPWSGLDYDRHQVQALYRKNAPHHLAEMQRFCDEYGVTDAAPASEQE